MCACAHTHTCGWVCVRACAHVCIHTHTRVRGWVWVEYTCLFSVLEGHNSYGLELHICCLVYEPKIIVAIIDEHVSVLAKVVAKQQVSDSFGSRPWNRHGVDSSVLSVLCVGGRSREETGEGESRIHEHNKTGLKGIIHLDSYKWLLLEECLVHQNLDTHTYTVFSRNLQNLDCARYIL